jgi:predicted component of type VI protein secretion system
LRGREADQQDRRHAAERRLADYEPRISEPFEFEAELVEKRTQHTQLEADLAAQQDGQLPEEKQDALTAFEGTFGGGVQIPGRGRHE